MEPSSIRPSPPPRPDVLLRPFEASGLSPAWVGFCAAIGWLLIVGLAHGMARVLIGPADLPFEPARFAWTVLVNASLIGLLLAGHLHLYRGAVSDLHALRSVLPGSAAEFERRIVDVPNLSPTLRTLVPIAGAFGGLAVATLDPSLRDIHRHLSGADPRYLVFVLQNILFGALGARLFAAEIHLTLGYERLGRQVEVDLFDPASLLLFGRKGLRSVVVWVLISSTFSMFWVLDSAGQANIAFPIGVLVLVSAALVAPTRSVHRRIAAAKAAETARILEAIRVERAAALAPRHSDAQIQDARLGNLIQYLEFVKSIREWPFDLSTVARSLVLIALGAGSWLGGAVVERLLDRVLD